MDVSDSEEQAVDTEEQAGVEQEAEEKEREAKEQAAEADHINYWHQEQKECLTHATCCIHVAKASKSLQRSTPCNEIRAGVGGSNLLRHGAFPPHLALEPPRYHQS